MQKVPLKGFFLRDMPGGIQLGFFSGSIHPENSMIVFRGSVTRPPEEPGDCMRYSLGVWWIMS